jgi:hypothetical protein
VAFSLFLMACGGGGGGGAAKVDVPISPTAPRLTGEPLIVARGTALFQAIIEGENFVEGSVVKVNDRDLPTTYLGPTRLSTWIPQSPYNYLQYQVINPGTPAEASPSVFATWPAPPELDITAYDCAPRFVTAGSAAFDLTFRAIRGFTGIPPGSVILWNGRALPSTLSADRSAITATIAASEVAFPRNAIAALYQPGQPVGVMVMNAVFAITLAIDAVDMVEDPLTSDLVALEEGAGLNAPVTLVRINPLTGQKAVLTSLPRGTDLLAFSSGARYLYLGAPGVIQRYQWPAMVKDLDIPLGNDGSDPYRARDLIPVPGSPRAIVVAIGSRVPSAPTTYGVFDDANLRPHTLTALTGRGQMVFGASPAQLFLNEVRNEVESLTLVRKQRLKAVALDDQGLAIVGQAENLFASPALPISYGKGKIYTGGLDVVDAATLTCVAKGYYINPKVHLLDPANDNLYLASDTWASTTMVQVIDMNKSPDFSEGRNSYPMKAYSTLIPDTTYRQIVRWGKFGLALPTNGSYFGHRQIQIFQSEAVAPFYP